MARKGYASIEQQMEANKRYLKNNPEAKERKKISAMKSNCKRFIREFATLEDLENIKKIIKRMEEIRMIKFNGVEFNLYEIKGNDMFLCENLEMFAWKNRVEFKVYESEIIPESLEELEGMIDEINKKLENKNSMKKGWYLIDKESDESY